MGNESPIPQESPLLDTAARISAFMEKLSIEVTRPSPSDVAELARLKRGARVFISAVPNWPTDESIAAAVRVRAAGLEPIPHVAVRNFSSASALDDFLARLHGEADVRSILLVAGDRAEFGPFRQALDVIESGLLQQNGIQTVGIAGYPDGHPHIGGAELVNALAAKSTSAEAAGLAVEMVTQFCFEACTIFDFIARVRTRGFGYPIRIGLAGPTKITALLRYASRCGVRASARTLTRRSDLVRRMLMPATPDHLVRTLAEKAPPDVFPHFFAFGGVPETVRWARAVAHGQFVLDEQEEFHVKQLVD